MDMADRIITPEDPSTSQTLLEYLVSAKEREVGQGLEERFRLHVAVFHKVVDDGANIPSMIL